MHCVYRGQILRFQRAKFAVPGGSNLRFAAVAFAPVCYPFAIRSVSGRAACRPSPVRRAGIHAIASACNGDPEPTPRALAAGLVDQAQVQQLRRCPRKIVSTSTSSQAAQSAAHGVDHGGVPLLVPRAPPV